MDIDIETFIAKVTEQFVISKDNLQELTDTIKKIRDSGNKIIIQYLMDGILVQSVSGCEDQLNEDDIYIIDPFTGAFNPAKNYNYAYKPFKHYKYTHKPETNQDSTPIKLPPIHD